jgi:hypothetical protein
VFREIHVYEIREILRLWLRGKGLRSIEAMTGVDRKTVQRLADRRFWASGCGQRSSADPQTPDRM